ncbi:MAG: transporter [Planctomycetota bacterium]
MQPSFRGARDVLSVTFLLLLITGSASAQLVTENAGTVSPETPLARLVINAAQWRHVDEFSAVGEFHYGFHPRFEGSVSVPFIYRYFEIGNNDDEEIAGFGDVALKGKVVVHKEDGVMTSMRTAVLAGIEFPTGKWDDRIGDATEPYARKLQLGSGTFDFTLGLAFTYINDRHRIAIDALGRASTSRDNVSPGPVLRVDLAYWFRLFPAVFEPGESGMELRLVVDAWYLHRYHTRGEKLDDSGDQVWLAPGLQFYATNWLLLEGNAAYALMDTTDDEYGRARWSAFVAVKILF